jgi:hypothetical protein
MAYKALTYINIPPNNRKIPGDTITKKELQESDPPQTDDDIKKLIDGGAMSEDMDAPINKAHAPIEIRPSANPISIDVVTGDVGGGEDASV